MIIEPKVREWRQDSSGRQYSRSQWASERDRDRQRERETGRERERIFPQPLWWEKKSHRAVQGHWMWIIEQCPTALSAGIRVTWRLWKAQVQGQKTPTQILKYVMIIVTTSLFWPVVHSWSSLCSSFFIFYAEEMPELQGKKQPAADWQPGSFRLSCGLESGGNRPQLSRSEVVSLTSNVEWAVGSRLIWRAILI